ncbi:hypothetical protein VNO78_12189 [Psophocarpus tetragonolobus]|uniref:Transmembrane protein n=1 Tax=Psophocarpus tetragonolobus TaxID=3891 RepID=A0AAN9SMJ7_PSOTE
MATKNLFDLIYESQQIMKAHLCHFYTLSLIFLFPISFSFYITSPTLFHLSNHSLLQQQTLLYSLILYLFSSCGIITITYSVFHFFYGQKVNLLLALKSIPSSLLPLFATTIVSQLIFFLISLFNLLLLLLLSHLFKLVHITIPHSYPPYTIAFFVALPLLLVLTYLQVNFSLVPVIVVVESCWGLEPLRRSARLIKGMKRVALSSLIFYGFCTMIFVLNLLFLSTMRITENWFNWVIIVLCSFLFAMIMLSNIVVSTLLYIYCKINYGEIAEEFGKDYVTLPFHDGKECQAV